MDILHIHLPKSQIIFLQLNAMFHSKFISQLTFISNEIFPTNHEHDESDARGQTIGRIA